LSYPANDVLRVTDGGREILVPMVKSIVKEIKPDEGRLVVDLLEEVEP
jgi:ribosomal 30S subunit maturation factor RimM